MSSPRILFLDIETFPQLAYTWSNYKVNVISVKEPWSICCFSAKWLGGEHVTRALPDYKDSTDFQITRDLWRLVNEADIVIAHGADRFDIKKINSRFLFHRLSPPRPFRTVDTLKIARKLFGFTSNKLDDLCAGLGLGHKMNTGGFSLWQGCMEGNSAAWTRMRAYNKNDVVLLEKLYYRLLPWINNHPNTAVYLQKECCPKCGSTNLQSRGTRHTSTRAYRQWSCSDCGGWSRSTKSEGLVHITNA